ncbi:MAG: Ig-like domain-containing protein, partial [Muribaculaceae bacterium]|nr:Ig-like domain-containing protein [Muribaculaceae bacterium]
LKDNCNSPDLDAEYGPYTEEDRGASNRSVQLIDGGNGLYVEFPEIEGPAEVTFFVANAKTVAGTIVLTDELGDTQNPLTSFELPAAKRISKYTYTYPYKGTVRLRLYNMKNQININDALFIKGEGEGIEKPVIKDEEAPVLVKAWPSADPYAPVEGTIVLYYNEPVVVTGKALVNGVETDVEVKDTKVSIAYKGLENGKTYTIGIPAIADEAGNELEASEMTLNTIAEDVLFYTDYNFFPYSYWDSYSMYPADGVDNGDIFAKNTSNKEVEIGGIFYSVGSTAGRVVAMGKSNLLDDPDEVGGSQRCAQISGGGNNLYMELPEVLGPCKLTLIVGNSTANAFDFTVRNAADSEEP